MNKIRAKVISDEAMNKKYNNLLNKIIRKINKACKKGQYQIEIKFSSKYLPEEVCERLKNLGYRGCSC